MKVPPREQLAFLAFALLVKSIESADCTRGGGNFETGELCIPSRQYYVPLPTPSTSPDATDCDFDQSVTTFCSGWTVDNWILFTSIRCSNGSGNCAVVNHPLTQSNLSTGWICSPINQQNYLQFSFFFQKFDQSTNLRSSSLTVTISNNTGGKCIWTKTSGNDTFGWHTETLLIPAFTKYTITFEGCSEAQNGGNLIVGIDSVRIHPPSDRSCYNDHNTAETQWTTQTVTQSSSASPTTAPSSTTLSTSTAINTGEAISKPTTFPTSDDKKNGKPISLSSAIQATSTTLSTSTAINTGDAISRSTAFQTSDDETTGKPTSLSSALQVTTTKNSDSNQVNVTLIAGCTGAGVALVIFLVVLFVVCRRRHNINQGKEDLNMDENPIVRINGEQQDSSVRYNDHPEAFISTSWSGPPTETGSNHGYFQSDSQRLSTAIITPYNNDISQGGDQQKSVDSESLLKKLQSEERSEKPKVGHETVSSRSACQNNQDVKEGVEKSSSPGAEVKETKGTAAGVPSSEPQHPEEPDDADLNYSRVGVHNNGSSAQASPTCQVDSSQSLPHNSGIAEYSVVKKKAKGQEHTSVEITNFPPAEEDGYSTTKSMKRSPSDLPTHSRDATAEYYTSVHGVDFNYDGADVKPPNGKSLFALGLASDHADQYSALDFDQRVDKQKPGVDYDHVHNCPNDVYSKAGVGKRNVVIDSPYDHLQG